MEFALFISVAARIAQNPLHTLPTCYGLTTGKLV